MKENKEIKKLEDIKYLLKEKGKVIINSKIKQNKIEDQLKRLKSIQNNIMNNRQSLLIKILFFIAYDIIMLLILLSSVSNIINNFILSPLLTQGIYVGVLSISIIGAYISSVIEKKINKYHNKKRLNSISNKIKTKEDKIKFEVNKQQTIQKEMTEIINYIDNIPPDLSILNKNYDKTVAYVNNRRLSKVRSKIKKNKNIDFYNNF